MFSSSPAALVGFPFFYFLFAAALLLPSAAARFASIQFSQVNQCGNFTVDFYGGKAPAALPLSLSVLPVNGTPISIPLPANAWNSTTQSGAAITFLPFPEGTEFIASLDDADGRGAALVSDVLVIGKSDTNDVSCLATSPAPFVPRYALSGSLKQCQSFSLDFDPAQVAGTPTVRAFVPKGPSFPVNQTVPAISTPGAATYLMDVPRDSFVVLMFKDQNGTAQTSSILPVLGDLASDDSCIPTNPLSTAAILDASDDSSTTRVTPKLAIVVIAVCVGVIGLVASVMIIWYLLNRRKAQEGRQFAKLDTPSDPEKQMRPLYLQSHTPPATSPLSPADSHYNNPTQGLVVRDPPYAYIRTGSALISPTSPDPKDPFGERVVGSILGPLSASARESRDGLGATALGHPVGGPSTLALPRKRQSPTTGIGYSPAVRSSGLRRSSTFDPASDVLPGTSPYWGGRLAVTPDNSLASNPDSVLRRAISIRQSLGTASVSSVEIDRILEMATIYGGPDLPDLPQPVVTAPATLRSSAYMAGRESRRQSAAMSGSPYSSPVHSRNNSATAGAGEPPALSSSRVNMTSPLSAMSALSHSASLSTLRTNRAFREPPLAPLPSSPLASPGLRPSFQMLAERQTPEASALSRNISSSTRQSMYSEDGDGDGDGDDGDGLDGYEMLQPPPPRQV